MIYRFAIAFFTYALLLFPNLKGNSAAFAERALLVRYFDETLTWLLENTVQTPNGYLIDVTTSAYTSKLALEPYASGDWANEPMPFAYQSTESHQGYWLLVPASLDKVYLSDSSDLANAVVYNLFENFPTASKWFFTEISETEVTLQYGWLYINYRVVDSLILLYDVTGDQQYLDKAGNILHEAIKYISPEDGRWYFQRSIDPARDQYTGMHQAVLMQALYSYLQRTDDQVLWEALVGLSTTHEHTAEGTYNHWTNSVMGVIIKDLVLDTDNPDYSVFQRQLEELFAKVVTYNGDVPYNMGDTGIYFKQTYQTYDTYLLAKLGTYAPFETGYDQYFNSTFAAAIDVNYKYYLANNIRSIYYYYKTYGIETPSFADTLKDNNFLHASTYVQDRAVARLLVISAYLAYLNATDPVSTSNADWYLARYLTDDDYAADHSLAITEDFDNDGLSNWLEYALNTDPTTSNGLLVQALSHDGEQHLHLTYTETPASDTITYTPQVSNDLTNWSNGSAYIEEVGRTPIADGTTIVTVRSVYPVGSSEPSRFIRLHVED